MNIEHLTAMKCLSIQAFVLLLSPCVWQTILDSAGVQSHIVMWLNRWRTSPLSYRQCCWTHTARLRRAGWRRKWTENSPIWIRIHETKTWQPKQLKIVKITKLSNPHFRKRNTIHLISSSTCMIFYAKDKCWSYYIVPKHYSRKQSAVCSQDLTILGKQVV